MEKGRHRYDEIIHYTRLNVLPIFGQFCAASVCSLRTNTNKVLFLKK